MIHPTFTIPLLLFFSWKVYGFLNFGSMVQRYLALSMLFDIPLWIVNMRIEKPLSFLRNVEQKPFKGDIFNDSITYYKLSFLTFPSKLCFPIPLSTNELCYLLLARHTKLFQNFIKLILTNITIMSLMWLWAYHTTFFNLRKDE